MNLSKALDLYLAYLLGKNCSILHVNTVRSRLRQFIEPVEEFPTDRRQVDAAEITMLALHAHFRALEVGRTDGTLAGYASTHRAFWHWLISEWVRSDSPAANLKRYSYDPKVRRAAAPTAVGALVASLPNFISHRNFHPRDIRDALVVSVALDSGSRIGEIRSIRRKDLQRALVRGEPTDNGRIRYQITGTGKTGGQDLTFFNESAELAQLWLNVCPFPKSDFVFISLASGHLLRRETMGRCFVRVCEFAGIPTIRSHAIRKRNASDIQRIYGDPELARMYLGHKSLKTTMIHYNDHERDAVSDAAACVASQRRGDPLDLLFHPPSGS